MKRQRRNGGADNVTRFGISGLRAIRPARIAGRRHTEPGTAPGTIRIREDSKPPVIHAIAWGPNAFEERPVADLDEIPALLATHATTWINMDGVGDEAAMRRIGEIFALHPLVVEDLVNAGQRPKVERYDERTFVVVRTVALDATDAIETEQLGIIFGEGFVLTVQERPGDPLDPVRRRLRENVENIREAGPDFIAYALIDAVVDYYYPLLERYDAAIDELEDRVLADPGRNIAEEIHRLRRDLLAFRRAVWPMREAVGILARSPDSRVSEETRTYLVDTWDHTIRAIEILEVYRELVSGLMEVYLSSVSNRMNEIMKVLTIIATIFIPLGFIASVFGMNFDRSASPLNMPELGWYWGYPAALLLMLGVAVTMLAWFHRKKWL